MYCIKGTLTLPENGLYFLIGVCGVAGFQRAVAARPAGCWWEGYRTQKHFLLSTEAVDRCTTVVSTEQQVRDTRTSYAICERPVFD